MQMDPKFLRNQVRRGVAWLRRGVAAAGQEQHTQPAAALGPAVLGLQSCSSWVLNYACKQHEMGPELCVVWVEWGALSVIDTSRGQQMCRQLGATHSLAAFLSRTHTLFAPLHTPFCRGTPRSTSLRRTRKFFSPMGAASRSTA